MASRILIVDDDPVVLKVLSNALGNEGYEASCAGSGEQALQMLGAESFDLLITDLNLGSGIEGAELLYQAMQLNAEITAIMITGYATVDAAVQAMKEGAFDFITKPFRIKTILETVANALHHHRVCGEAQLEMPDQVDLHYGTLVGESEAMQAVYGLIQRVGKSDATVLIEGEAGTGKDRVAEAINAQSSRCGKAFLSLDCAERSAEELDADLFGTTPGPEQSRQLAQGAILSAEGGTLLLKHIHRVDLPLQGKLLQVLQNRHLETPGVNAPIPVDIRLIATSSESLEALREDGRFREDLYYRVGVLPIHLPPLRHRLEDIPLLVRHFCTQNAEQTGDLKVECCAMKALAAYGWPGNVRELENTLACAAAMCQDQRITRDDLPPGIRRLGGAAEDDAAPSPAANKADGRGRSFRDYLRAKEREYLQSVLEKAGGDYARAAELLGVTRATLSGKLAGISAADAKS
mgnify:CR=1 FL=1